MSLRPRLHLRTSRGQAGQPLTATLICDSDRPLEASQLQVTLRGVAQHEDRKRPVVELVGNLDCPATLAPGRSRIPCHFELPPWLPPSFDGHSFSITYRIHARVDLPWWPDARAAWKLDLDSLPGASAGAGPVVAAGDSLSASVHLDERGRKRSAWIELQLIGMEHPVGSGVTQGARYATTVATRPLMGDQLGFTMEVPAFVRPSFTSSFGNLSWQVQPLLPNEIYAGPALPITITAPRSSGRVRVAQPVPDRTIDAVWGSLASELGLTYHEGRLTGHVAATSVVVRPEPSPSRSAAKAELGFRSLGIGLVVEQRQDRPPRGLHLDPGSGDDPGYFIDSRAPGQGHFVLSRLASMLRELPQVSMTDTSASFHAPDVARNRDRMLAFMRKLPPLAAAIERVREEVPTPPGAPPLEAWIDVARAIAGKVTRGDLSVNGHLRGMAVAVLPQWRVPASVSLAVRPSFAPASHWHGAHIDPVRLPPEAQAALLRAAGPGCALSIGPRSLVLDGLAITGDPRELVPRLSALVDLAERLRDAPGPFR